MLNTDDPIEIAWQIANVALHTEEIQKVIVETMALNPKMRGEGNNPDLSIVIELLENGDIKVLDQIIKS